MATPEGVYILGGDSGSDASLVGPASHSILSALVPRPSVACGADNVVSTSVLPEPVSAVELEVLLSNNVQA
ncbi:unnamed protein product [Lupinus luteus]|uniref:Uncharacterized protein n=1 Tax=Lupinus luteus TaxID=3873 RepID=A0AAV1WH17_LUPLU